MWTSLATAFGRGLLSCSVLCGTVTMFCGFGSDFGKFSVPIWIQVRNRIQTIVSTLFQQKIFVINLVLFMLELEEALIPDPGSKRSRIRIRFKEFKYF